MAVVSVPGFTIDISHWQPNFGTQLFRRWRDELRLERVIIKLGGANNGLYISSDTRIKADAARSAGLAVEWYWFNGRADSFTRQAQTIAASGMREGERLWWDVEHEGNMAHWSPAETVRAARALEAAGVPLTQQGIYLSESIIAETDWAPVAALGLALWVAAYRGNDGKVPVSRPRVTPDWSGYTIWQYASRGRLPGHDGDLDLNTTLGALTPERAGEMSGEELAYWLDFYGNPRRRSNAYGEPGPRAVYSKGYHRGEDIASSGSVGNVPALTDGTVVGTGRSGVIGFFIAVVYDTAPDRIFIYCHMHEATASRSGRVYQGQIIGRTAAANEFPGTGWTGPHLHIVVSTDMDGGYNTTRPDFDPRPYITRTLEETMNELADLIIRKLLNTAAYTSWEDGTPHPKPPTVSEVLRGDDNVFHGLFNGGPSMKDGGKAIQLSVAEMQRKLDVIEKKLAKVA